MPPRGYGRKPSNVDQPLLTASGEELLRVAMMATGGDDPFSLTGPTADDENEDIGVEDDGNEEDTVPQEQTPSRRSITDLNFSPAVESLEACLPALDEEEEESAAEEQHDAVGPAEPAAAAVNVAGSGGATIDDDEADAGASSEDDVYDEEDEAGDEDAVATGEEVATTGEAAATGEDAAEGAEEEDTEGANETAEEAPGAAAEEAGKAAEGSAEGAAEEEEEEVCDEGVLDLVQECLLELGVEVLNMSVKQIIAKVEASTGADLSEWKKPVKKIITDQAALLLKHQAVAPPDATPAQEAAASDTDGDAEDDGQGAGSEYEDSDDSEDDGKAKGRLKKGAKKGGKPSKATIEELEAVKEEEEVRAKNQAIVETLQGDASERKAQTNAKITAMREKIRLKSAREQAERLNRAAAQLQTIRAAEKSPESVAGLCSQAFMRSPVKGPSAVSRQAPAQKWGGVSHSPKNRARKALRAGLLKQRVYKAGEFFAQENSDDKGLSREQYLLMLKEDELQKRVMVKAELDRKALEVKEAIFAHEDDESDEGEGDEEDNEEDERANAGVRASDGSAESSAEEEEEKEGAGARAKPSVPEDEGGSATLEAAETGPSAAGEAALEEAPAATEEERAHAGEGGCAAAAVAPKPRGIMAAFFNKPAKASMPAKETAADEATEAAVAVEGDTQPYGDTQLEEAALEEAAPDAAEGDDEKGDDEDRDDEEEEDEGEEEEEKAPVDRAAAYRVELEREALAVKARKKARKGGLLDEEAEEEEEEAEVAGLGDFGFAVAPKAGAGEEEERVVADEADFENIVDELSDGEGDEDAGKQARARKDAAEDQDELLEMKRRLKEGNLGARRGGRQDARGNFREDQLMGFDAEQKESLRKAGLATESDDEDEDGNKKEKEELNSDDELDQALKARHGLAQESRFDPRSESEDEDEDAANDGSAFFAAVGVDDEAREERDAARAARRWEKQVKMRRVLSEVGGERSQGGHDEESQSLLSMLKRSSSNPVAKTGSAKLARQSSFSAGGAGSSAPGGAHPFGGVGAPSSAAAAAMAGRMAAPLSIRPFPGAAHPLGGRKGSFVDKKKRIAPTAVGGRLGTVSNQRFVFGAAAVPAGESDSLSCSGSAWADHAKPKQGVSEGARKGTMNTAMFSLLAANRFKRAKTS